MYTRSICAKCSGQQAENKWLPKSINEWRETILKRIVDYDSDDSDPKYAIFSNVAYNLQYLEYINRCFEEQYLTSVLRAQSVKTFTLTTAQIIECLLYIKLIEMKVDKDEIWEFSRALRVAGQKNAYALGQAFYMNELNRIKDLRNKIHLQSSEAIKDADYGVFVDIEVLNEVKEILYRFMQKSLSLHSETMKDVFYFLLPTKEYIHSIKNDQNESPIRSANNNYEVDDSVVLANNKFAFDIYSQYKDTDDNIFLSPFSISSALAMTYEGAKGDTAAQMQSVFGFPLDDEILRTSYAAIFSQLNKKDSESTVSLANALWIDKKYELQDNYLNIVSDYYGGKATNLDFKADNEQSRLRVNRWVEDTTNNKIKSLIREGSLDPNTKLLLTNAIYFKGSWLNEFYEEDTEDRNFKVNNKNTIKTPTMLRYGDYYSYTEDENQQVIELPYKRNTLSMMIILPRIGKQSVVEASLSAKKIDDWDKEMSEQKVKIFIPKFKIETSYKLGDTLRDMGMPLAFSDNADFSSMNAIGEEGLKISEVIHKAFVDVNEEGTEAAAATDVFCEITGIPTEEPVDKLKIFRANRPFMFLIRDTGSGNILFLGRINDPTL